MKNIIAIVFDFDITLSPYFQQKIIFDKWGIEEAEFWKQAGEFMKQGYDQEHAYLRCLIDYNKKEGFELIPNPRYLQPLRNMIKFQNENKI